MPAMCVYLDKEGKSVVCAIENAYMQNNGTKDNLAVMLRKLARKHEAVAMLFTSEVWMRTATPGKATEEMEKFRGSIANLPGSKSMMMIQEIRGGSVFLHIAEIVAPKGQPRALGEWQCGNGTSSGRFVDDIAPVIGDNYSRYVN